MMAMIINKDSKVVSLINKDVKKIHNRTLTKESWAPSTKNTNRCKYTEAVERIFRCNLQYTRKDISLKFP